ncbi:EF-hand calcium-binding domain-containing protein 6 [Chiloscyllium plagiosum]|uniref:EF-hand calcium-binding domain-containing protein 6 n=1 Tax=Chiloscyllium plagiosum TaxID=36176 RepID=UPI001CB81738|nr:EF-hand calcium-binding domain-containing protein 6 [Chiloscyllium plagiosum]
MAALGGVSRPPSHLTPRLQYVQHPLSRLGDPETISVRGFSRSGDKTSADPFPGPDRPAPNDRNRRREPVDSPHCGRSKELEPGGGPRVSLACIPEGVQVTFGTDPDKPRLPIFGQRADLENRTDSRMSQSSRISNRSRPGTQLRIEIDELEHQLREKIISSGYFAVKQLFKANDPEGKGQLNRDVLLMVLTKFLGRFITPRQYQQLLLRFKLNEKTLIKCEDFYAAARDPISMRAASWLDPVTRHSDKILATASQVHSQLKDKVKQRLLDLTEILPQKNIEGPVRILLPEFRDMLKQLGYHMDDDEFEKLWRKYDPDGIGIIKGDVLMRKLGAEFRNGTAHNHEGSAGKLSDQMSLEGSARLTRTLTKVEHERNASLHIEKWLRDKFREGYNLMKEEFEKYDPEGTGKVLHRDFLAVLAIFGLHLKDEHFNLFLARCNLENSKSGIKYIDFLRNFQDRSEKGIPHKILNNPKHKFNCEGSVSLCSTVTAIEAKLTRLFQSDFLALLATFHKIDKLGRNIISQQEFRAAIESRFGVEITDEEFELLIDRIPLDEDGNVWYPQFMAMFDSRKGVSSIFDEKISRPKGFHENELSNQLDEDRRNGRTPDQLFQIIKTLLCNQYQEVEREFEELDEINSRRLNHETMYRLLKRFDICPEVTRGEIRKLWQTLITNQDKTLDFLEFVRHFGHSPKSACFPNAKISPPRKGDCDFRMRSKNLNCASDILVDSVRAKVDYLWDDLRKEFQELDPYSTGFVSKEEFKDILTELCMNLNEYECEMLAKKFEINGDGRVYYLDFLKPFAMRRQQWREGSNMLAVLQHPNTHLTDHQGTGLDSITTRLRKKLKGEWKSLRRAFKKLDNTSSGYLSLPEFRAVLKLCDLLLNEDEVYHIMSKFDENLEGKINYKKFLEETYKKEKICAGNKDSNSNE